MGTRFSEDDRISGRSRDAVNTSRDIVLMFAYSPIIWQPDVRLVAPRNASKTTVTRFHIIQFESNRDQSIKKTAVAVAVIALSTVGCSD